MREKTESYLTFPGRLNQEGNTTRSERKIMTRKGKKKRVEKLERSGQRDLKRSLQWKRSRTGKHRVLAQTPYDSIAQTHQSQVEKEETKSGESGEELQRIENNAPYPCHAQRKTNAHLPLPALPFRHKFRPARPQKNP